MEGPIVKHKSTTFQNLTINIKFLKLILVKSYNKIEYI